MACVLRSSVTLHSEPSIGGECKPISAEIQTDHITTQLNAIMPLGDYKQGQLNKLCGKAFYISTPTISALWARSPQLKMFNS